MDGKVASISQNKRGEQSERHKEIKKTDVREDHKEFKGREKTKEVERELCDKKRIQRDGHKPKTAAEATVTVKKWFTHSILPSWLYLILQCIFPNCPSLFPLQTNDLMFFTSDAFL